MDDILLMDAVERMLNGEMSSKEKLYFDELRKNNPDLDQTVVEHIFFLQHIDAFKEQKDFRHTLSEVENTLREEGVIHEKPLHTKGKIVKFWTRYKRTIGVAASIAGVVSVLVGSVVSAVNTDKSQSITPLVKKLSEQETKTRQIESKLNQLQATKADVADMPASSTKIVDPKFRATGFMIDNKGNYLITNTHVVDQAKNSLIVEDNKGRQYAAKSVYVNKASDLAIIQIVDTGFEKLSALPFNLREGGANLGEEIFILGFPKQEVVYNEGYISARNGYMMDTIYTQLSTNANEGSSGSPVITRSGDLVGVITSKEANASGVVFASKASNILHAIEEANKVNTHSTIKINSRNSLKGLERVQQIKKIEDYIFMVKGN